MVAADFLQINSLQNLCCQYLRLQMDQANCIGIYLSAKARNCKELAQNARRFALEHFRHVVREEEFLQLPFGELKAILESQLLNTTGEGELLEVSISIFKFSSYVTTVVLKMTDSDKVGGIQAN